MHEGFKLIAGMTAAPVLAIAALVGVDTPLYIPSGLMAQAAQENRFSADARKDMARALYGCRKLRSYYSQDKIGLRYRKIGSWRNDAGWLGRTYIDCADGSACAVRATALIAAPRESRACSFSKRKSS